MSNQTLVGSTSEDDELVEEKDINNVPNSQLNTNTNVVKNHEVTETGYYGQGDTVQLGYSQAVNPNNPKDSSVYIKDNTTPTRNKYGISSDTVGTQIIKTASSPQSTSTNRSNYSNSNNTSNTNEIKPFTASSHSDYWNSEFQSILDNTKDVNYKDISNQLRDNVNSLSKEFSNVQNQMEDWKGESNWQARKVIDNIQNKFQVTMDNINDSLDPACTKIEEFKEKLEQLKKGKEVLTGEDGNGGLDKELKEYTIDYEEKKSTYDSLKEQRPSPTIWDSTNNCNVNNPEYSTWLNNMANASAAMTKAKEKMDEKDKEVKAKEAELDALLTDVLDTYESIKSIESYLKDFADIIGEGIDPNTSKFESNMDKILEGLSKIPLETDYFTKSKATVADRDFFEELCKNHKDDGWNIDGDVVTMYVDGKECTYDMKRHMFSDGSTFINNSKKEQKVELEVYFYLPSNIAESKDYSQLKNLDTYTFFSSNKDIYTKTIDTTNINTFTMRVTKQDPFSEKYDTVANLTKLGNSMAGTDTNRCHNIIAGDSVYGAHSLKIAASNGDLYDTVYCIDNAAIVTGINGKEGTKEQFSSEEELKGLNNKNVYFINTSGDDNYSTYADMSVERGRAFVPLGNNDFISSEDVKQSFTYSGIELVAKNCPDSKIHVVYQSQDTEKEYQRVEFPKALDELASKYNNVWNDSDNWDSYAKRKYKTHSEGNYIPYDLLEAASTTNPYHDHNYSIAA